MVVGNVSCKLIGFTGLIVQNRWYCPLSCAQLLDSCPREIECFLFFGRNHVK